MEKSKTQLGFGTASLTSIKSYPECLSLLKCAYENGISLFDTAPLYGKGYAEVILGKFIKNKRSKIEVTTKFGLGFSDSMLIHPFVALPLNYFAKALKGYKKIDKKYKSAVPYLYSRSISKTYIEKTLNQSLKNLQTDYIDNFMLHEGLPQFISDEGLEFLLNLKKKGVILNLGVAANSKHLETLNQNELDDWEILQYDRTPESEFGYLIKNAPNKVHFLHSILKNIEILEFENVNPREKAGYLLAQVANANRPSKLLFSTRKKSRLLDNISSYNKFIT